MTERRGSLLRLIEDAFQGVELGDGVSLHETVVLDDYGRPEERRAAREPDEKQDWRKLVGDPELIRPTVGGISGGGLCFYDTAGLRFYLPAYLCRAVTDPEGGSVAGNLVADLRFHLTRGPAYNPERFAALSARQRACVREVLKYLRGEYDMSENGALTAEIDHALEDFWA